MVSTATPKYIDDESLPLSQSRLTSKCKTRVTLKNGKARLTFSRKPVQFWNKIIWTDETTINFYKNYKRKVWRSKAHHLINTVYMGMHGYQWNWITSVTDTVTADGCSRIKSKLYRAFLLSQIQSNDTKLIWQSIMAQIDNDLKHTIKPKSFKEIKRMKCY